MQAEERTDICVQRWSSENKTVVWQKGSIRYRSHYRVFILGFSSNLPRGGTTSAAAFPIKLEELEKQNQTQSFFFFLDSAVFWEIEGEKADGGGGEEIQ